MRVGDLVQLKTGSPPMVIYYCPPGQAFEDGRIKSSCQFVACWQRFGNKVAIHPIALEVVEAGPIKYEQPFDIGSIVRMRVEDIKGIIVSIDTSDEGVVMDVVIHDESEQRVRRITVPYQCLERIGEVKPDPNQDEEEFMEYFKGVIP